MSEHFVSMSEPLRFKKLPKTLQAVFLRRHRAAFPELWANVPHVQIMREIEGIDLRLLMDEYGEC